MDRDVAYLHGNDCTIVVLRLEGGLGMVCTSVEVRNLHGLGHELENI